MVVLRKIIIFSVACNIIQVHCMNLALETKVEFVERAQKLSCSKRYTSLLSNYFIEPHGAAIGYYAASPDNTSHVLLRPAEEGRKAQLVVLNKTSDVYARQFLGFKKFIAVALAARCDLFATIHETPEREILKIRRVDTKKTLKKIALPTYFEVASAFNANSAIAFNKQGTDIIVWGADARERGSYRGMAYGVPALDYMIFNFEEDVKAQRVRK